ncbi:Ca-activated chloride channel family protein [Parelusimicrobium proximum]|uniref:vWA domain-containing protein n=1 Tax=Parelusimicrobium proximum TaxID=3228953 RepID=UPI003D16F50C
MKNTDKDIIERFQNFDFDKEGSKKAAVLSKLTAPAKKKGGFRYGGFAFAASFCVVLLAGVFVSKSMMPDMFDGVKGKILGSIDQVDGNYIPAAPRSAETIVKDEKYASVQELEAPLTPKQVGRGGIQKDFRVRESHAMPAALMSYSAAPAGGYTGGVYSKTEVSKAILPAPPSYYDYNSMQDEDYSKYTENTFSSTLSDPLSTFSSDVDTASYGIVKSALLAGRKVNPDSVRIEEFINYFDYDYPQPKGSDPVSISFEYTDSPWNKGLKLVKIGVKAKDIAKENLPPSNMVFLIDISGSMYSDNRLPLVKKAMKLLAEELRPEDKVSIVTYANGVHEVLSGAKGNQKEKILNAVNELTASGGTSGSAGLETAYEVAKKNFIRKGNNRIILATDGDFNIGPRSNSELEKQITKAKDSGVFLSVLGFGMGNYKDSKVQTLANKGNGNYAYINDLSEAKKVLVNEFGGTLFTVAKDVKLQAEFNPEKVAAYRLIGYEKRKLNTQDFNDDQKDAGEMGAGHTVTVLYEIIPAGVKSEYTPDVDGLKYGKKPASSDSQEVLTVKLRYKDPDGDKSKLMESALEDSRYVSFDKSSDDMRFAASVAQFGQLLKQSPYKGSMTLKDVVKTAKKAKGSDDNGYRAEFIKMADLASLDSEQFN